MDKDNATKSLAEEARRVPDGTDSLAAAGIYRTDVSAYLDIIDLPHHVSLVHAHMSLADRAAQFSPFSALVGLD